VTSLGFVRLIRGLRPHCRVLAPDLPGFGPSEPAETFDGTLAAYAAAVEEFCGALDLRDAVFYVNDSSGAFGLVAAARLHRRVAGLVVADTVPVPLTGLAWPVKLVLRHVLPSRVVRSANRRWNLLPWLVATVAPWRHPFTAAERATLVAQFDTPRKRDRILDVFGHMGWDDAFMRDAAEQAAVALADTPTLILYGQFDPMRVVGGVRRYRRLLRNHRVVIVPWEEHFPMLAEGDRVADAIRAWLETVR
jgi:pimeloyl-ACP methyl ester carboxylesterase